MITLKNAGTHAGMNNYIQTVLLAVVIVLIPTTPSWIVWQADAPVFVDFRGILFYWSDLPLVALCAWTLIRLTFDATYRNAFADTVEYVMQHGGVWWAGLLFFTVFGVLWASEPTLVRYSTLRLLIYLFLALIVAHYRDVRILFFALAVGGAMHGSIALAQFINGNSLGIPTEIVWAESDLSGFGDPDAVFRAYGLSVNPNNLAGYLSVTIFAALALRRFALAGYVGLALLATGSITATAATLLGLTVWMLQDSRIQKPRIGLAFAVVVLMAVVGLVLLRIDTLPSTLTDRLFFAFDDTNTVIQENPVLGTGGFNLMVEIGRANPFPRTTLLPAHNAYWVILAEHGMIGLMLFIGGIARRGHGAPWCAWIALCAIMLLDFYPWLDFRTRTLVFIVLGMVWARKEIGYFT